MTKFWFAFAAGGLALPASAEVVSADAHAFEIRHTVNLAVPPQPAFAAFGQVQSWWSKDHTYSGDSTRLTLDLRPGGCFCERLDDGGGIEHLRVSFVQPGKRLVLTGSLGPLLYQATAGVMDVQFDPNPNGSRVSMSYRAAGFAKGGAVEMAPLVDKVLGEQMKRLAIFIGAGGAKP